MMIPQWTSLSDLERGCFRAAVAFLHGRLEERATIEWALRLNSRDTVERLAVLEVLNNLSTQKLSEPWLAGWRLIEESWKEFMDPHGDSHSPYRIRRRIRNGDRSGPLIDELIQVVQPIVEVKPLSDWQLSQRKPPSRPRSVNDLMSVGLTSRKPIDPSEIGLEAVLESSFLVELGHQLDAAVMRGLNIGRRIGWTDDGELWRLGQVYRVYFVPADRRPPQEHEPDEFHRGIAPSVKLLHATVSKLGELDLELAQGFVRRWYATQTPIHVRLWAAFACDPRFASSTEVGAFLLTCDDRQFWNLHQYPEIAELRAVRFTEFNQVDQEAALARLRRRPPRNHWPRKADKDRVQAGRTYWAVREFRRIEIAGALLPNNLKAWLNAQLAQLEDLRTMARLDEGFLGMPKARWVPPNPDNQYDLLRGIDRLAALEAALAATRQQWDNNPAGRASDWMRQEGRAEMVLADFESAPAGGAAFPRVWDTFGWAHVPPTNAASSDDNAEVPSIAAVATRVLTLLNQLPQETARGAIEGIAAWLSTWQEWIVQIARHATLWLRYWPIAVAATNEQAPQDAQSDLNVVVQSADGDEPMDLDTLNTPAGKLVGVFLAGCPNLSAGERPFDRNRSLRDMRDAAVSAPGRSGLIVLHRMIEALPWFLAADPQWAKRHLLEPLLADNPQALTLWRAVSRRTQTAEVLGIIGEPMADRTTDFRLGRETRSSLVWSLTIESLHALRERRNPAVPYVRVQQMLRSLDDEVRAFAAETLQRFVRDLSKAENRELGSLSEILFREAVQPFLEQVWPQERSLATPGVARAFADLPAACGEAFAEAVNGIERFLVPFECWSMVEYGLYGEDDSEPKLSRIDNYAKAEALLRLLDRTIGTAEGAIVPMDLSNAVEQIRNVAPQLEGTQTFRRLGALSRR